MKWYEKIRAQVASLVIWAEKNLKGKTGKEKRRAVLDILCEHVRFPVFLEWIKRPVLAFVVNKCLDQVCAFLNIATDHEGFDDVEIDAMAAAELSALPKEAITRSQDVVRATKQETVDARIAELFEQYGIKAETAKSVEPPKAAAPAAPATKKSHFARSEFACKCGCGTNKVKQELIDLLNDISNDFDAREGKGKHLAVTVTSGTRCAKRNAACGGAGNSRHLSGEAADIQVKSLSADTIWSRIRGMWKEKKLPALAGLGRYDTIAHVEVGKKKADGSLYEWDYRGKK